MTDEDLKRLGLVDLETMGLDGRPVPSERFAPFVGEIGLMGAGIIHPMEHFVHHDPIVHFPIPEPAPRMGMGIDELVDAAIAESRLEVPVLELDRPNANGDLFTVDSLGGLDAEDPPYRVDDDVTPVESVRPPRPVDRSKRKRARKASKRSRRRNR